jgi:hypothetical protein
MEMAVGRAVTTTWLAGLALGMLLVGCAEDRLEPQALDSASEMMQRAHDALDQYDRAVIAAGGQQTFVPISDLAIQVGEWEPGKNASKAALLAGRLVTARPLPAPPAATGEVVWENGTVRAMGLVSADDGLRLFTTATHGNCSDCTPIEVTAASLTTMRVKTSRGPTTTPAWEYTLAGTAVRLKQAAVAPSATVMVTPLTLDPAHPSSAISVKSAATASTGTELTVAFDGAGGRESEKCGADYTGQAVEGDTAVVVIVIARPYDATQSCAMNAVPRTATVNLAQPLGDRAVLEVVQGLPVPVAMTG